MPILADDTTDTDLLCQAQNLEHIILKEINKSRCKLNTSRSCKSALERYRKGRRSITNPYLTCQTITKRSIHCLLAIGFIINIVMK